MPQLSLTQIAYAQVTESPTAEQLIEKVALKVGVASTTLYNLAYSESTLGQFRVGDGGKSCGIVHFHKDYYPEENSRCDNDEYILTRAAEMIRDGLEYRFTPCNCFSYASLFVKLPQMAQVVPNSPPHKNAIAIFYYGKTKHIAVVTSLEEKGFWVKEANKSACLTGSRFVEWGDKNLRGFWASDEIP